MLTDTSDNTVSPGQIPLDTATKAATEISNADSSEPFEPPTDDSLANAVHIAEADADSSNLSEPPASSSLADTVDIAEANAAAETSDADSSDLSEPPASSSADAVDIAEANADPSEIFMAPASSLANAVDIFMAPADSSYADAVEKEETNAQPSVGSPSSDRSVPNFPGPMPLSEAHLRQLEPQSEPVPSLSSAPNSLGPMPLSDFNLHPLGSQFLPVPFRESSPLDLASSADLEFDAPSLAVTLALRQAERAEEAANLSRRRVTEAYQRTEQPERVIPGHAVVGFSIDIEASNIHPSGTMHSSKANQRQLESQSESWESSPLPPLSSADFEFGPPPSPAQDTPVILGHAVVSTSIGTEASNIRKSNEHSIPASRNTSKGVQPRPGSIHVANPASRPGKGE
ncbi:MAG: hypothetical protein Q9226_005391 [Calogaya cf. arnoldii]